MPKEDLRFERHYELWKDQTKQMTRWVVGMGFLAIMILWKVLTPHLEYSHDLVDKGKELEIVKQDLTKVNNEEEFLGKVDGQLTEVKQGIQEKMWVKEIENLKGRFKGLNASYANLQEKSIEEILSAFERRVEFAVNQAFSRPDSGSASIVNLINDLGALQIFERDFRKAPNHPGDSLGSSNISREEYKELLSKKYKGISQEMADSTIRKTVRGIKKNVIGPLENLHAQYSGQTELLKGLPARLKKLQREIGKWEKAHLGKDFWYRTVGSKNVEMEKVTKTLEKWQNQFLNLVSTQQGKVEENKKRILAQQQKTRDAVANIEDEQDALEDKMEATLPEWVRGFINIREMFQLYPSAILLLFVFLSIKAGFLRFHFQVVRQSLKLKNISGTGWVPSSIWTLVYRGLLETAATALTYIIIIILFWLHFEVGTDLTNTWVAGNEKEAWTFSKQWLGITTWLGPSFFIIGLISIASALFLDWKVTKSLEPSYNPG